MQGFGSALDRLLRHTSRSGLLVPDVLEGRSSLIEAVRCCENGLLLLKQVEHTPNHKADVAQGGVALRCARQLQHRFMHPPKQDLQRGREGGWDRSKGHRGHRWS